MKDISDTHRSNLTDEDRSHAVEEARQLFNAGRFWHVHEALERIWLKAHGDEKRLLQGLIMAAAARVHAQKNALDVSWSLVGESLQRLENQPAHYWEWDVERFRAYLKDCLDARQWHEYRV